MNPGAAPLGQPAAYAELHCLSSFSFLQGASQPDELVARAAALGYTALAITDECSVAGLVRAHQAAREHGLQLLPGASFRLGPDPPATQPRLVALARDGQGWGNLCEFITQARRRAAKGSYLVDTLHSDFSRLAHCELLLVLSRDAGFETLARQTQWAAARFAGRLWLAVELLHRLDDDLWLHRLRQLSALYRVPLVASGGVQMHVRSRKPLHDVLTAIRLGRPVHDCLDELQPNAEAHLRSRLRLANIYPPELLARTQQVAQRCRFSLDSIRYRYPRENVPAGLSAAQALRQHTLQGMRQRYPQGTPWRVRRQLVRELRLIAECDYEMYFLTVHDIVRHARSQGILCQGRGSAANSAVCYCLGITAVDPARSSLLFERFISRERREPPDIDVDFEHQRREEVIQYIYAKYGHDRAALAATVIRYRPRSALRDVGRALGLDEAWITRLAREHFWFDGPQVMDTRVADAGLDPHDPQVRQWLELTGLLIGFPRHLSQHVGGFVLTDGPLTRLVPVENAAMPGRSVIQWDKDDLEDMGLMKVDVLALGMLSAIRGCLALRQALRGGPAWGLADIPAEDPQTYRMIRAADTVGTFQIESRAQMSMLPRLKPRVFYDLVVQVAIVRPGPIQGGMVHPYLQARERSRQGLPIHYERDELRAALERTLGVPIFQEQVMQIAMIAAGFSAGEADALRRSMAAWKRRGGVHRFEDRLIGGMLARGYSAEFARGIFRQILGFGEYGFPESHAHSFALIAYASSWLKCHEPACYLAAMLNAQPLGFYSPSQLVQDAQRHQVEVLPVDVTRSDWDCTLEDTTRQQPSVRLGLRMVSGLGQAAGLRIVAARQQAALRDAQDLAARAMLDSAELRALATADALASLAGHRRQQVWEASAARPATGVLRHAPTLERALQLGAAPAGEEVLFDYQATGLSLRQHPLALLRQRLQALGLLSARQLRNQPDGSAVSACGLVTTRQQPQTAKGTVFVTLEDETGSVNVIVWKHVREQQRAALLHARLLAVHGHWQRDESSGGRVCHLVAARLDDLSALLGRLSTASRDFH